MAANSAFSRNIVIGENGRFSNEFVRFIKDFDPSSQVMNISTRTLDRTDYEKEIAHLSPKDKVYGDTIFWCSGSASSRSSEQECKRDEEALSKFISTISAIEDYHPRICYLSSGGTVYGKSPGIVNEDSQLNPESHYAEMKVRSEELLKVYASNGTGSVFIFRVANVYGSLGGTSRKSLIDAALINNEIEISVNLNSTKQYGTYQDYTNYIVNYVNQFHNKSLGVRIQNTFSTHSYSVGDILRITRTKNPHRKEREISLDELGMQSESTILSTKHYDARINNHWISLEDYIETLG